MGDAAEPRELRRTFIVPAIKPFDHYDFARAKIACNLAWLVAKAFGTGRRRRPRPAPPFPLPAPRARPPARGRREGRQEGPWRRVGAGARGRGGDGAGAERGGGGPAGLLGLDRGRVCFGGNLDRLRPLVFIDAVCSPPCDAPPSPPQPP